MKMFKIEKKNGKMFCFWVEEKRKWRRWRGEAMKDVEGRRKEKIEEKVDDVELRGEGTGGSG